MKPGADGVTASCASKTPIITTRCRRHDGLLHLDSPQWTETAEKRKRGPLKINSEKPPSYNRQDYSTGNPNQRREPPDGRPKENLTKGENPPQRKRNLLETLKNDAKSQDPTWKSTKRVS